MEATPINVDYRETQDTIVKLVAAMRDPKLIATRVNLEFGDLWWATEVTTYGVELKSGSDFLSSLYSKAKGERLERQLSGLRQHVDVPILGIHGVWWDETGKVWVVGPMKKEWSKIKHKYRIVGDVVAKTKMHSSSVTGGLWSFSHPDDGAPVSIIQRASKEGLLAAVAEVYAWSKKVEHKTFKKLVTALTQVKTGDQWIRVIASISGVGEEQATKLRKVVGSPAAIIDDLRDGGKHCLSINGIGKKTITKLMEGFGI